MTIDTIYLSSCIDKLEKGHDAIQQAKPEATVEIDLCRHVVINQVEIVLEQAGKLLRKFLLPYFHSKKAVDNLTYNDTFRHAGHHGIMEIEEVERWLQCRQHYNSDCISDYGSSHDSNGEYAAFYNSIAALIPQFIIDARALVAVIEKQNAAA